MQMLISIWYFPQLLWALFIFFVNPYRLDNVISISKKIHSKKQMQKIKSYLHTIPEADAAMKKQFVLSPIDLNELAKMPIGSLGKSFADFVKENNIKLEDLQFEMGKGVEEWIMQHYYETHDLWHVVTGFDTEIAGELGLQAFYAAKGPSPFPLILLGIGLLNTAVFAPGDRDNRMKAIARGWQLGKKSRHPFGVEWNKHWQEPLKSMQSRLQLAR